MFYSGTAYGELHSNFTKIDGLKSREVNKNLVMNGERSINDDFGQALKL
jgi:hypothetical protein